MNHILRYLRSRPPHPPNLGGTGFTLPSIPVPPVAAGWKPIATIVSTLLVSLIFSPRAIAANADHVIRLLTKKECMGCDLIGADLTGADLSGAQLIGADLRGANLQGADLSEADLSGAIIRWANLSNANLTQAKLSQPHPTKVGDRITNVDPPLLVSHLTAGDLRDATLSNANFYQTNLPLPPITIE